MTTARINKDGDKIILKLSFREAAGLRALLARVGVDTNEAVSEATEGIFYALDAARDTVEDQGPFWPEDYDAFAEGGDDLADLGQPQQLDMPFVAGE